MPHGYGHTSNLVRVDAQGRVAPPGYHFMPDGRHAELYGGIDKAILLGIKIDYSDIKQIGAQRTFVIDGTEGAVFSLEIKASNGYYYNFETNLFQASKSRLDKIEIFGNSYQGFINFPEVSSDDQYDIYLWAETNTKHSRYYEARFDNGSIDLNRSKGSNSYLVQKVIYQYTDHTLTLSPFSVSTTVTGSATSDTITVSASPGSSFVPFEMKYTATSTNVFSIITQPTVDDFIAFTTPTVGNPVQLPEENIYPEVNNTDTVDGDFTAGTSTKIVMDTNVANKMVVGDKITIATADATDTVDGAVSNSNRVVMDNNVVTKMAVGDEILVYSEVLSDYTMPLVLGAFTPPITVTHLNPDGDNAKEFQASENISLDDGATLKFIPKCNRELFTVAALNPDEDNVKEFSYVDKDGGTSSRFGVRDGSTLSFSNQMNHKWEMSTVHNLKPGMILINDTNITENTVLSDYKNVSIDFDNTPQRKRRVRFEEKATRATKIPTITKGRVTDQDGTVVFNKQQKLALTNDTIKVGGYGEDVILFVSGYKIKLRNLKVELQEITTTTTSSTIGSASTSVAIASRTGILNDLSIVSGIGIDGSSGLPYVDSGAGATSAGTVVLSAAQELESGITLTFTGSSNIAIITGEIQVLNSPPSDFTLRLDVDRILQLN
jgi:hypothetical protein